MFFISQLEDPGIGDSLEPSDSLQTQTSHPFLNLSIWILVLRELLGVGIGARSGGGMNRVTVCHGHGLKFDIAFGVVSIVIQSR